MDYAICICIQLCQLSCVIIEMIQLNVDYGLSTTIETTFSKKQNYSFIGLKLTFGSNATELVGSNAVVKFI